MGITGMMQSKIVAITGGIGSGKSEVCAYLKSLGYVVLSADEIYKNLQKKPEFIEKVYRSLQIENFNYNFFDTKKVANIVFNDPEKLKILNEITHPIIMKEMLDESKKYKGIVFNEVPLLFESQSQNYYDEIIVIVRPLNDRIKAVNLRDNLSEGEILKRINTQIDYEKFNFNAHTVIVNDGSISSLKDKVKAVIEKF